MTSDFIKIRGARQHNLKNISLDIPRNQLVVITGIIALVVAAVPFLLLVGLFSLFMSSYLPWILAAIFVMPLFFPIAFSPWVALGALEKVFTSTVWTLTYREVKSLPTTVPELAVEPVGD